MAGTLGAAICLRSLSPKFPPFKPRPSSSLFIVAPANLFSLNDRLLAMASQDTTTPKKLLRQNGAGESASHPIPFFRVKKLSEKAVLPSRASPLSAGYDLSSEVDAKVPARGRARIPTDLSIAVLEGTYARVAPRSGLTWKYAIDVGAGVIDADYRGSVGVLLFNHSDADFEVKAGDRIAQLIIAKIATLEVAEVDDLDSTVRGAGGFGSTGV